jgi:hypothetical protein
VQHFTEKNAKIKKADRMLDPPRNHNLPVHNHFTYHLRLEFQQQISAVLFSAGTLFRACARFLFPGELAGHEVFQA